MYYVYLLSFKLLHAIGLKKTSVRLARHMEKYCRHPLDKSKLYDAVWEFTLNVQQFPWCQGDHGCYFPVLSDDDEFHKCCREAEAEHEARIAAEEEVYQASLRKDCYEQHVKDGYCQEHWDEHCSCQFCGKLESECKSSCICAEAGCYDEKVKDGLCQEHWDVENTCFGCGHEYNSCNCNDADDEDDQDDECPGGCGQTERTCTCAELASWRAHDGDGYWTA